MSHLATSLVKVPTPKGWLLQKKKKKNDGTTLASQSSSTDISIGWASIASKVNDHQPHSQMLMGFEIQVIPFLNF